MNVHFDTNDIYIDSHDLGKVSLVCVKVSNLFVQPTLGCLAANFNNSKHRNEELSIDA